MFRRSTQSRRQPVFRLSVNPRYAQYVSTARVWNLPPTLDVDARLDKTSAFAKTGTIDVDITPSGIGVQGDGSTGLYSRTISLTPQAMWIAVQFVCNTVSTIHKTAYALGSASASSGAFVGINSGINSTDSNINSQFRSIDSGVVIAKLGPVPVVGMAYTVVSVFPSALKADAYLYINGVKYTTDYSSSADISFAGPSTLVNEAVGALKRGATSLYSSDTVLFTARGTGQIPESLARQISLNPYSLLQEQQRNIYRGVAASSPTIVTLDPATLNFSAQDTQNTVATTLSTATADLVAQPVQPLLASTLTASALNFTAQDVQNSVTNNLTAATFDFVAHDIAAENASTATVTLDTATFDFVANDNQNALYAELSAASFDFVLNGIQNLRAQNLTACAFDFAGQDTQNTLGLLLENAIFDFVTRSITAGDPLAPTTGRATNMMLMGVGN